MNRIFYICLLVSACFAWTDPVPIVTTETEVSPEDIYSDPKTLTIHLLYFRPLKSSSVEYVQIFPNNTVESYISFSISEVGSFIDAAITGQGDGNNLMVMLNGKKKGTNIYEIYYTESKDGGVHWTKPRPIPRENMEDSIDRYTSNLLYVPQSRRYFIFYHIYTNSKLAFVTKPAGSEVFSLEKTIYYDKKYGQVMPSVTATYSIKDNVISTHVFWLNSDGIKKLVYYMKTTNNGIDWSDPVRLSNEEAEDKNVIVAGSSPKISDRIVVTYQRRISSAALRMMYSNSHGEYWTGPMNFTNRAQTYHTWNYKINSIAFCHTNNPPLMLSLSKTGMSELEYSVWNLDTMQSQKSLHPFSSSRNLGGAMVSCTTDPLKMRNPIGVAIAETLTENGEHVIMLSRDEIASE